MSATCPNENPGNKPSIIDSWTEIAILTGSGVASFVSGGIAVFLFLVLRSHFCESILPEDKIQIIRALPLLLKAIPIAFVLFCILLLAKIQRFKILYFIIFGSMAFALGFLIAYCLAGVAGHAA